MIPHRFVEACALLPLLHVSPVGPTTVLCLGSHAEKFAADCLRWRDVQKVHLLVPPALAILRDKRVEVGVPVTGTCSAVLTSPDENGDAFTGSLKPDGIYCVSTLDPSKTQALLQQVRKLFPRNVVPWRDHLPETIFGALASPRGAPQRKRDPPGGARHLHAKYMPCLFTFAADETPLVFGAMPDTVEKPEVARAHPP